MSKVTRIEGSVVEYAVADIVSGPDEDSSHSHCRLDGKPYCVWYRIDTGPWRQSTFRELHKADAALKICESMADVRWVMECD